MQKVTAETEWKSGVREGYLTKTIVIGNATITIDKPILSAAERAKREEEVVRALRIFGEAMEECGEGITYDD